MLFLITILSICITSITGQSLSTHHKAIYNGTPAALGEFRFIVSLQLDGSHFCAGTILSNRWVLTAAHCLWLIVPPTFITGSNLLSEQRDEYKIAEAIIHPHFEEVRAFHDIALLKSFIPIKFTENISNAQLPKKRVEVGALVSSAGWGATGEKSNETDRLLYFNTSVVDMKACRKALRGKVFISESDFCTLSRKGQGICKGDSGGPVVDSETKEVLHGVTSRGVPCAMGLPDVFVDVYSHLDWIKSVIG